MVLNVKKNCFFSIVNRTLVYTRKYADVQVLLCLAKTQAEMRPSMSDR